MQRGWMPAPCIWMLARPLNTSFQDPMSMSAKVIAPGLLPCRASPSLRRGAHAGDADAASTANSEQATAWPALPSGEWRVSHVSTSRAPLSLRSQQRCQFLTASLCKNNNFGSNLWSRFCKDMKQKGCHTQKLDKEGYHMKKYNKKGCHIKRL